jgi:hypothetical protein
MFFISIKAAADCAIFEEARTYASLTNIVSALTMNGYSNITKDQISCLQEEIIEFFPLQ